MGFIYVPNTLSQWNCPFLLRNVSDFFWVMVDPFSLQRNVEHIFDPFLSARNLVVSDLRLEIKGYWVESG